MSPAVVTVVNRIDSPQGFGAEARGSGVIIDNEGRIITNNHVVEGAQQGGLQVIFFNGDTVSANLVGADSISDLAVLKVDGPVPGTADQVDINVNVTERSTGSLTFGAGYSSADKIVLSGGISQANLLGSGNALSLQINSGSVNKVYSLSYLNPYWTVDGVICYSKICTHVGCPISLWEQQTHHLLCPCHQSTFDLADHAKVVFGPAARPLPQLPIAVDDEGYLVAQSDFNEPIGASYWEREKQ